MAYKKNRKDFNIPLSDLKDIGIELKNISPDLPLELLDQLSFLNLNDLLISIIKQKGGEISLDEVLISLYKITGKIYKRISINSRLYRMTRKQTICLVQGKRTFYCINNIKEE